ncbi:hypothetical protein HYFRA_00013762 [Hymenoscyphus fraxineus]|uniref:Mannan endo-1,6-alpha-mannosidase n=1 Tax=Hymenoscyphus fraxineus TaxID=746836 RepID=A0A9N9L6X0_9HELO|nr:hypothetical protein HYFRA_00013762 [Hymenoscyphus fraxineus]
MRVRHVLASGIAISCSLSGIASAITLDITSASSIKDAAKTIAKGTMSYYTGYKPGDNPGNLPDPYYWWEAGAMFGTMVEYWYYTGDTEYNPIVKQALISQIGDDNDYMPTNQTKTLGNDDQGFWGMSAMTAAELKFEDPDPTKPGWLALAQAVFNDLAGRWDETSCDGGLRWQIFAFNNGYTYKNSVANGCLFNLAARLAVYTGNSSYADWAVKTWDWMEHVGLMSDTYAVFDGSSDLDGCKTIDHRQWSYNQGIFLFGAAMMYNFTSGSDVWEPRVQGLLNGTSIFFKEDKVMFESACEDVTTAKGTCNTDQQTFKGFLSRWMAATSKVAPFTHAQIQSYLQPSAKAAALQCSGGTDGVTCGEHWSAGATWDGLYGVGQQMSALSVVQSMLIDNAPDLVTNTTGGTSAGNAAAGAGGGTDSSGGTVIIITGKDKAGAGILTALVLSCVIASVGFMVTGS